MPQVAPVARLKKSEIVWLSSHRCKHSHTYLSHFSCYLSEMPEGSPLVHNIGFFDIETSGFKASSGFLFGYAIKDLNSDKIYESWLEPQDRKKNAIPDQKRIVKNMVDDLKRFDLIVGYYSSKMDIPFARTKALMNGIKFPEYGELIHFDLYYLIRNKFSLHSNSLQVACETLLGSSDKTRFSVELWNRALFGDQDCMDMIADHCRKDVCDTQKLYELAVPFRKRIDRSV